MVTNSMEKNKAKKENEGAVGKITIFIFLILILFFKINLFLAALGLCCCTRAFSSCGEWGLLFVAARGLLTAVASLVAEHGL